MAVSAERAARLFRHYRKIRFSRTDVIKLLEFKYQFLYLSGLAQMNKETFSKEEKILQIMRKVLTDIAKDTYTPADLKHPLSENTIVSIRDCLALISSRENELAKEAGRETNMRPRYVDEPSSSVVVKLEPQNFKPNKD